IAHIALVKALEGRLEAIDAELARVQKLRKKIEQRAILLAQAEIRQTRTRRQTRRPDYVYFDGGESDDGKDDEYAYQEDEDYAYQDEEEHLDDGELSHSRSDTASGSTSRRGAAVTERRRSTRAAVVNGNGKRAAADPWSQWRGERRSTRLGAPPETQIDEPRSKRARTEESTISVASEDFQPAETSQNKLKVKQTGAAAIKPTEVALEQVRGKKKSKFWYYAVEPIPGAAAPIPTSAQSPSNGTTKVPSGSDSRIEDGQGESSTAADQASHTTESTLAPALEGSLSPPASQEDS
ncbi:hypothetical protein EVG20_g10507, partial [Dentipellis fragilis]